MTKRSRILRRSPLAIALLILGAAGLLYLVFSLLWQSRLPSDGVLLTEPSSAGTSIGLLLSADAGGLQVGDLVLSIQGRSVSEWIDRAFGGASPEEMSLGQTVRYRVQRAGVAQEVQTHLQPMPIGRLLLLRPGVYLLALACLAVGGYILLARPDEPAARLVFALNALAFPLVLHFQTVHLFLPALFLIENILKALGMCLTCSAVLHLFLIFPSGKPWLRRVEKWLPLLHLVNPLLSTAIGILGASSPSGRLLLAWECLNWTGLAMIALAVASIVHTYVTVPQPAARSQIRWVAWGSVVGILPFIFFTGIPEAISGRALLGIEITSFFLIVLPLAMAIAIARYRLFDIDTLIHRSLLYGLLLLVFGGLYVGLVTLLSMVVVRFTSRAQDTIAVFLSTLITATAFWALRGRLLRLIGPFFFRAQVDPAALLAEMSERLSRTVHLGEIARLLGEEIPARLGATRGGLMVIDEAGTVLEMIAQDDFQLPVEAVREGWAGHLGEPISRLSPASWVPDSALQVMEQRQVELALPLTAGEELVGLWSLSARRSGQPYSSVEMRTLSTLARQAAIAVQNARLVRRLEQQNRHLEELVRQRTRALEEEKAKFVSTVSHELRTPVTSILGFTRLIQRTLERSITPALPEDDAVQQALQRVRENLDVVLQEEARLTDLITDVLDIAAIDADESGWHDRPTDLLLLIEEAVAGARAVAREKGLAVETDLPAVLPLLDMDADRLLQVLTNLLSNALKFTEQGRIVVSARQLSAGEEAHGWRAPSGGAVLVAVSDTGVGIMPEALESVFQRFYQGGDLLRNKPAGTGLGLAICREIVRHYGGVIWAESSPGVGSTFSFTLPLPDASPRS